MSELIDTGSGVTPRRTNRSPFGSPGTDMGSGMMGDPTMGNPMFGRTMMPGYGFMSEIIDTGSGVAPRRTNRTPIGSAGTDMGSGMMGDPTMGERMLGGIMGDGGMMTTMGMTGTPNFASVQPGTMTDVMPNPTGMTNEINSVLNADSMIMEYLNETGYNKQFKQSNLANEVDLSSTLSTLDAIYGDRKSQTINGSKSSIPYYNASNMSNIPFINQTNGMSRNDMISSMNQNDIMKEQQSMILNEKMQQTEKTEYLTNKFGTISPDMGIQTSMARVNELPSQRYLGLQTSNLTNSFSSVVSSPSTIMTPQVSVSTTYSTNRYGGIGGGTYTMTNQRLNVGGSLPTNTFHGK